MRVEYVFIIVVLGIAVWWLRSRTGERSQLIRSASSTQGISDQELAKLQSKFERCLASEPDLPDGIRGRDAYIYWQLMRHWFSMLDAKHRYDDEKARRLRQDWCDYLELLPRINTTRFLAREAGSEDKAALHDSAAEIDMRRVEFIQDAFAEAIGLEAMEQLRLVRARRVDAFDRTGMLPLAPEGQHYFPVSLHPYIEECRPDSPGHKSDRISNGAPS